MKNKMFQNKTRAFLASAALASFLISTAPANAKTFLQLDFDGANPWPKASADVMPSTPIDVETTVEAKAVGTIDVAGATTPSGGLLLKTTAGEVRFPWIATYSSGLLPVKNTETNLGKLTLSLNLSASSARPVIVRVESFNAKKIRSGGLETTIYPAAPDFYQRYALDFSTMSPNGAGKFNPTDPNIQLSFEIKNPAWGNNAAHELRIDNVHLAVPAYYVSATGNDKNDGQTEATAFARPQKAVDVAGPGDIIVVMNGTYKPNGAQEGIVRFQKTGAPSGWISLKNYPGHKPLFDIAGTWVGIRWWRSNAQIAEMTPEQLAAPTPSYIEVRGLHIRGEADVAKIKYPDKMNKPTPETNGNGISVGWDAQPGDPYPHHLRFADNLVENCPGAGIGPGGADWLSIENNIVRNNSWTTMYGTSGISINGGTNFDGTSGGYRTLIRNNIASGNRTFEIWKQVGKISDGNGIIVDVNQNSKAPEELRYNGRTLIQNNVTFNNGGSGIHAFKSKRIDIINNTVYMNSASPELTWGQLFVQQSEDVRMVNNLVVAPPDQPVNTVGTAANDQNSKNIVRLNNLYFGGGFPPIMGEGDKIADPLFVNPAIDAAVADFRLKPGSPALGFGRVEVFSPYVDINGKPRGDKPTVGAFQQ